MRGSTFIAGIVILILCGALATADYVMKERPVMITLQEPVEQIEPSSSASSATSSVATVTSSALSSSLGTTPTVVKKGTSTKKATSINVADVLARLQLIPQPTSEASFLALTAPKTSTVQTSVLLRNNDRAFLFAWTESPDVKIHFAGLKQALQEQFSGKVTDLIDEVRSSPTGTPVDYLSFMDPALSPERVVFLRVRTRLYEFHVATNGADLLEQLITAFSA